MKIALAQINFTVGDFEQNQAKILEKTRKAHKEGAGLVVFSELAICGYPPLDLLERKDFVERCILAIEEIARQAPREMGVIVGGPEFNHNSEGKLLYNTAYFLHNGKVEQVFRKALLPTYDIFDEYRYFEPSYTFGTLDFNGVKLAVTICEDLWDDQPVENPFSRSRLYTIHPMEILMEENPHAIINIAASPFSHSRQEVKRNIFTDKAGKHHIPVFMTNQVGGNTELLFEGGSLAVSANGSIFSQMKLFEEDFAVFDLEQVRHYTSIANDPVPGRIGMIHDGLILGIRDYFAKLGFQKATLGLSGGIDSAVVAVLAVRALGPKNLHFLLMPSQYSSEHSVLDAELLSQNLEVSYSILPIRKIFDEFRSALNPIFGERPEDITEENIQSRIRGTLLMALSNKMGHILLNTSNKSETAVGYGTLYGDMAGGLSVMGDVYKTDVYELAQFINRQEEVIPGNIITKPPSAELRPDQKDSDSLPDYELLDEVLNRYIEKQLPPGEIISEGFEESLVRKIIRMVNVNEYKRYQTPPILRISSKAFGGGRRIPLAAKH